ncbi:DUF4232 domain-containing protein [Streptomyces sp. NP160]|uniref:DUF4232 domain-containing protein n=1 Tax=Streptomyces sp. NP160 TaxID=2586637 RepID=UPI00111B0655|nr:DUF4232 domain-containing protein [Streptomyces sp. NP160]TNM69006.1 DUF4232 domain-containing protein [Streptomyces sp. NP160]
MIGVTGGSARAALQRVAVVASAGVLAWSLGGCSSAGAATDPGGATTGPPQSTASTAAGSSSAASDGSSGAPVGSEASSPTGSAPATGSSGSGGGTSGAVPACRTADLALSLLPGEGGASAGHQHDTIQFTNRGSAACALDGHPGVSLVTGDSGQQLGAAATREGSPAPVRLGPGASAYADLSVAEAGDYDAAQCQPQAAKGLRVYPPDQTAAAFVPADGLTGCASSSVVLLVVDPVVAGR